jgi:hypothetical protein
MNDVASSVDDWEQFASWFAGTSSCVASRTSSVLRHCPVTPDQVRSFESRDNEYQTGIWSS